MKQVQKPKKPLIFYYLVAVVVIILLNFLLFPKIAGRNITEVDYSTFLQMVEQKQVSTVEVDGDSIYFTDKEEQVNFYETTTFDDPDLVNRLDEAGCKFGRVVTEPMNPILSFLLSWVVPILIFVGLGQLLSRQMMKKMGGGTDGNPFMQFGKSNAKVYVQSTTDEEERNLMSQDELTNKIATLTGGRCAEKLIFHSVTTRASNGIEQATKLARAMITRFGMSEKFGMVALETQSNPYLGGDSSLSCSPATAKEIDLMVVETVKAGYDKAMKLLEENKAKLHELAKYLYEKETITGEEFMQILNGKALDVTE